jgi:histidine ammonia-lyase
LENILALELMSAAQGVDFRREKLEAAARLGQGTQAAYDLIRQRVPFLEHDAIMYPFIEAIRQLVADGTLAQSIDTALEGR